jgi:hypothetical protein
MQDSFDLVRPVAVGGIVPPQVASPSYTCCGDRLAGGVRYGAKDRQC